MSEWLSWFAMKWWDWMPWCQFLERWILSQLFHSLLSLSSRGSLVSLWSRPLEWYHLHIWGYCCFFQQSWFQLVIHPLVTLEKAFSVVAVGYLVKSGKVVAVRVNDSQRLLSKTEGGKGRGVIGGSCVFGKRYWTIAKCLRKAFYWRIIFPKGHGSCWNLEPGGKVSFEGRKDMDTEGLSIVWWQGCER